MVSSLILFSWPNIHLLTGRSAKFTRTSRAPIYFRGASEAKTFAARSAAVCIMNGRKLGGGPLGYNSDLLVRPVPASPPGRDVLESQ